MKRSLALLLVLGAVAACGDGSGGDTPSGPATAGDYATAVNVAYCQLYAKCGTIGASQEKACEAKMTADAKDYPSTYSYDDAVKMKRLSYDPVKAGACLATVKVAGCTLDQNFALYAGACGAVFTGLVPVGGACQQGAECAAGGWCDQGMGTTNGCMGTCKALVAHGATCDPQNPLCVATDFCDGTATMCAALLAAGASCSDYASCATGLTCRDLMTDANGNVTTPGTCAALGKVGDDCVAFFFGNTDCTPGLFCDGATSKCIARLAKGASCDDPGKCGDGLACIGIDYDMNGMVTTNGTCLANLDLNQACDPTIAGNGCPSLSQCDATKKTCQGIGEGTDCSSNGTNGNCDFDLVCDATSSVCTKQPPLGGACTPPSGFAQDPCHDGSCDPATMTCKLVCM